MIPFFCQRNIIEKLYFFTVHDIQQNSQKILSPLILIAHRTVSVVVVVYNGILFVYMFTLDEVKTDEK